MDREEQRRLTREAGCATTPVIPAIAAPSIRPTADCDTVVPQIETFSAPTPASIQKLIYDLGTLPVLSPENSEHCVGSSTLPDCAVAYVIVSILEGSVSWRDIPLITDTQLAFIAGLDPIIRNSFGITVLNDLALPTVEYTATSCAATLNLSQEQAAWLIDAVVVEATSLFGQATTLALSQLDCGYCNDQQVVYCEDSDIPPNQNGKSVTIVAGEVFSYISKEDANASARDLGLSALQPCEFESEAVTARCSELAADPGAWITGGETDSSQTINGKIITTNYDTFSTDLASPVTRITTVAIAAGAFLSTDGVAAATSLSKEYALSLLVCFVTADAYANCPGGALGSEADPINSLPGNFVHIPLGMTTMVDLSSIQAQYDAQVLADDLASSLLNCEWGNTLQEVQCPAEATVTLPDGAIVLPPLSGVSHSGLVDAMELIVTLQDIPDGWDQQTYVDEQALTLANSRLYCVWCNADIPGYCLPSGIGSEIPVIPLTSDSPEYGPQPDGAAVNPLNPYYWSKDATVGVAAGTFCEEDPAVSQAAANAIGIQPFIAAVDFADATTCSYGNAAIRVTCLESFKALGKEKAELLYNWDSAVQLPADMITVTKGDYTGLEKPPRWSDAKWDALSGSDQLWKELANEMAIMQAQALLDCKWANVGMTVYCGTTDLISPDFYQVSLDTGEAVFRDYEETYRFGDAGLHGRPMIAGPHGGGNWNSVVDFADSAGSEAGHDIHDPQWPFTYEDIGTDPSRPGPFKSVMIAIPDDFVDKVHFKSLGSTTTPIDVPRWVEFSYSSPQEADVLALQSGMSLLDCFVKNVEMGALCSIECTDYNYDPPLTADNVWGSGSVTGASVQADAIPSVSCQYDADAMAKLEAQGQVYCIAWNDRQVSQCPDGQTTFKPVVVVENTISGATRCEANAAAIAMANSLAECQQSTEQDVFGHPWMMNYTQDSGDGSSSCPRIQIMAKDSILYDFDGETKLFTLTNTLADETAHRTCKKIKFILHVEIDGASKEFKTANVYVHEGTDDPPGRYNLLYGPQDGPQEYYNIELATSNKSSDIPMIGPDGRPMALLTQKVYSPLCTTEVIVEGLTYITAVEGTSGDRPSIVPGSSFNPRCIFPWGPELYLVRLDYGRVIENRFNSGAGHAISKWLPIASDDAVVQNAALCPTGESDHWDLLIGIGTYMKLVIHVDEHGLIVVPPADPGNPDGFVTAVALCRANGETDEELSIHYVPPTINGDNVGAPGVYHIMLFRLSASTENLDNAGHLIPPVGFLFCQQYHFSDVAWFADKHIEHNLEECLPGTNSARVAKQFNTDSGYFEKRVVKGTDNITVKETGTSIEISFDPTNTYGGTGEGVVGGTGWLQILDCNAEPLFELDWKNGLITTNDHARIRVQGCPGSYSVI